ncbi:MAG: DNA topoisomerase I [Candidatus Ranarchaeia archaeon]
MEITTLRHNGVLVPNPPPATGLRVWVKGKPFVLDQVQEQMAMAWAQKVGTPYVEDRVFRKNFFNDFKKALGLKGRYSPADFNLDEAIVRVTAERERKASLTKEERKALAEERKKIRLANKEKYGYAFVNGECVEIANYTAEPSCIFMGRGKHPLRGRWKAGPKESDIILNLDPDAPMPPGKWKGREWCPESLWIAKWRDKLSGKMKYVWIADSAAIKQEREREKYDKANVLKKEISKVRSHIRRHLEHPDPRIRKIATVCYLIDKLALRVGDEKDEDEADTVGATTLRPEHILFYDNGFVEFSFLGKDSVPWNKKVKLPDTVRRNLKEFIGQTEEQGKGRTAIFKGIGSQHVSNFLDQVLPGLSAKVFRTYHASHVVKDYLYSHIVDREAPEYEKKRVATLANLEAAIVCNHMKQVPKKFNERIKKQKIRYKSYRDKLALLKKKLEEEKTKIKLAKQKAKTKKQKERVRIRSKKFKLRSEKRLYNASERINKTKTRIELMRSTAKYNLTTSLKNYIDPRIYKDWGEKVDYPWEKYYSSSLRRKFSWLNNTCERGEEEKN